MFKSAKIQLTLWYMLIIFCISGLFSVFIYTGINGELEHMKRLQEIRIRKEIRGFVPQRKEPMLEIDEIIAVQRRLRIILLLVNAGIICIAGVAAYFLAGKTLNPIQEMVEEQNRFITDASHEIRTPLTAMKTSIEVNLRDTKLSLTEAKELLKDNLNDINTLKNLSDNLLTLSTIKHSKKIIQQISLEEILNHSLEKVKYLIDAKDITLKKDIQDVTILGEKERFIEVFIIFFDNAIKYSPIKSTIHLSSKKIDGHAQVIIQDEGVGISEKDIPHIFERFYRADTSRTQSSQEGYGLGLSIAKEILDSHKATIKVKSEVEKGTTFIISFPIKLKIS